MVIGIPFLCLVCFIYESILPLILWSTADRWTSWILNDTGETILDPIASTRKIRREQYKQFGMFEIEWNKKDGLKWEKVRYEKEGS